MYSVCVCMSIMTLYMTFEPENQWGQGAIPILSLIDLDFYRSHKRLFAYLSIVTLTSNLKQIDRVYPLCMFNIHW